jgi:transportin-3
VFHQHLESFLPQLHSFVSTTGRKLAQEERSQVYEAIAHVISAMGMDQAAQSLRTFAMDILAAIHAASKPGVTTKEEFKESCCE